MTCEDANDAIVSRNHSLFSEEPRPGHAGRAGRLTANSTRPDFRFCIQDLLICHTTYDAVTNF